MKIQIDEVIINSLDNEKLGEYIKNKLKETKAEIKVETFIHTNVTYTYNGKI